MAERSLSVMVTLWAVAVGPSLCMGGWLGHPCAHDAHDRHAVVVNDEVAAIFTAPDEFLGDEDLSGIQALSLPFVRCIQPHVVVSAEPGLKRPERAGTLLLVVAEESELAAGAGERLEDDRRGRSSAEAEGLGLRADQFGRGARRPGAARPGNGS